MTLIKSISGIRGTVGGFPGEGLTPLDVVKFTSGYAFWVKEKFPEFQPSVVVGRDGRLSGALLQGIVANTLAACGLRVLLLDYTTTPSVEMAVKGLRAQGGIILTASHNPIEWNALKLLNAEGEFVSAENGARILELSESPRIEFPAWQHLGVIETHPGGYIREHVEAILKHPLVNPAAVAAANFRVVVDAINSTGGLAVPLLLEALGVREVEVLNATPMGHFAHNPEPLAEHLQEVCKKVKENGAHLGIVVDPDVDRLAFIQEDGVMFGEENTLVAVARYYLKHRPGPVVNNLSSSRALRDVASALGCTTHSAPVGEVHVVARMKETGAVLGGEGNGGVIVPELHYGRDALAGIALMLTSLALEKKSLSALRQELPQYEMAKKKVTLPPGLSADGLLRALSAHYSDYPQNHEDGLKVDFPRGWLHIRKSNTEPIVRIYSEAPSRTEAEQLAADCMHYVDELKENALSL
ncbi:MAG: phosphoglucosamine mutase [Flavobacteriales bacterium]|nr:phosphoglucosamine mutase [Flavobacteriales bacterium]MDW8432037.1 phosphoglucosamine mutase [Flavobacteriales bacterium]